MPKKPNSNQFSVFGTRPENAIYLPDLPYSVRLNCKDGGLFVGGNESKHRKTEPDQKVEISIVKASKHFGTLGKTENVLWIQLFYIAAPSVPPDILPKNVVCVSYIKKQSIGHLFNTVQEALDYGDPGFGIFTLGFNREVGEKGTYYTISFDWRERQSDEEKQQLEIIKTFMIACGNQLADLEGTREMACVDGWTTEDIQALIAQHQGMIQTQPQDLRSLPAAA
jgi:hypothetical protein